MRGAWILPRAAAALAVFVAGAGCERDNDVVQSGVMGTNARVGSILVRSVHIEAPPGPRYPAGAEARLWFTIVNDGAQPDALTAITSPAAAEVRIRWDSDCDGRAQVVDRLPFAAAGPDAVVTPTGIPPFDAYSGRLVDLTREVIAGSSVEVTFEFARAGTVTTEALVQPSNATRPEPSIRCVPATGSPGGAGTPLPPTGS